jgi:hypothetical protein
MAKIVRRGVHTVVGRRRHWMDSRQILLARFPHAITAPASRWEKGAERESNLKVRGMFEDAARRFRELAETFERARRGGNC